LSDNKFVLLENGKKIAYDKLLIATGASAVKPEIKGANLDGVFTFHTLQDTHKILDFIAKNKPKKVVVIGSGMTGLECADALYTRGLEVTVIERNTHVLFGQSDLQGAALIEQRMKQLGIHVYLDECVTSFDGQDGQVKQIILESGKIIETNLVICAIGVRPNIRLAQEANIKTAKCGIMTNEYMQTRVQDIYAAGDVACVKDFVSGKQVRSCTWPDACMQAIVAAKSMVVKPEKYNGAFLLALSEFFGIKFASCGPVLTSSDKYKIYVKKQENIYSKILLEDNIIKGFLLIGDTSKLGILNRYFKSGQKIDLKELV